MIIGVGTDIIQIQRLAHVLERHPRTFARRVFTAGEERLAAGGRASAPYYAGRWAAKEAIVKALGCGIGRECGFLDIEILNDGAGRPVAKLSGAGGATMDRLGVKRLHLSISHDVVNAVAFAVAEG